MSLYISVLVANTLGKLLPNFCDAIQLDLLSYRVQDDFIKALQTWNTWKPMTWISQYRVIGEQILEFLPQAQNASRSLVSSFGL